MNSETAIPVEHKLYGDKPSVLFLSGMHGDEYESGCLLHDLLLKETMHMPPHLFLPKVSPSAVAAHTRTNKYGHDINRQFFSSSDDHESQNVMQFLAPYHFDRIIDVHEDPDRSQAFYLYDSKHMTEEDLGLYRALVHATGARLYTGIDDFEDKRLGYHIDKGYISMPAEKLGKESGFFVVWSAKYHIADRGFTLEVPGKAPRELKRRLLFALIPFLLHV